MRKENSMAQEEIDNLILKLKENIKKLSDRELLENIYITLNFNVLSNIVSNSLSGYPKPNPLPHK